MPASAQAPARARKPEYFPVLDGLRGVAILLVLIVHSVPHMGGGGTITAAVNSFFHSGVFGVDLFFVLSGFLITGILLDSREKTGYFGTFYYRRIARLFPVYYGFLALLVFVTPFVNRAAHVDFPGYHDSWWWYVLYFSNWKSNHDHDPSLGHFWSLALEEQFYFFWPLTVYLLSRRALAWFCGGLIILAVGMRVGLVGQGLDVYAITPSRLDALCLGALVALAIRDDLWRERFLRHRRRLGLITAAVFLIFVLRNWRNPWNPWSAFFGAAWFSVLVFQGAATDYGPVYNLLNRPIFRQYGRYSYCIYVIHLLFIGYGLTLSQYLRAHMPRPAGILVSALVMLGVNAAIYWTARFSWRYYEQPILRVRDRAGRAHEVREGRLEPVLSVRPVQ